MEEKKCIKIKLSTLLLIVVIILIAVFGIMGYMMYQMNLEIKQLSEKITNSTNVIIDNGNIENNNDNEIVKDDNINAEDTADITSKCKNIFEEYHDIQVELFSGGSLYVLKKLNLVSEMPSPEQYETISYDGEGEYYKTDIKYSDLKDAMLKYMTEDLFENEFENIYVKNVNGHLEISAMGGSATYIEIDTFELSSSIDNSYVFDLSGQFSSDDDIATFIVKKEITFEKQNGEYVVSNEVDKN